MNFSDSHRNSLDAIKIAIASRRQSGQRRGRLPNHLRLAVLALVKGGLAIETVASETGVSAKAIASWLDSGTRKHRELVLPAPRVFAVEPASSSLPRDTVRLLVGSLEINICSVGRA